MTYRMIRRGAVVLALGLLFPGLPALAQEGKVPITVESLVQTGHRVSDYTRLVDAHEVDVLVFHSRDEDQVAMHGTAYPLAVELRSVPLLLI